MTSHRKYILIWLLLPLLALRAVVPAGFMIDTTGDSLSMVVCTGGVHHQAMMEQRGEHAPADDRDRHKQTTSVCPFAAAASAAPMPSALPIVLGAVSIIDAVTSDLVDFHSPFGPSRTQQSRAPPSFS